MVVEFCFCFFSKETLICVFNIRSCCQVSPGSAGCSLQLCCAPLCSWHQTHRTDGRQRRGPNTTGHNTRTRCCISSDLFFILFSMSRHREVIFVLVWICISEWTKWWSSLTRRRLVRTPSVWTQLTGCSHVIAMTHEIQMEELRQTEKEIHTALAETLLL